MDRKLKKIQDLEVDLRGCAERYDLARQLLWHTEQDLLVAATIAQAAIRCLLGFDAWTLKEKTDARDKINDILHQYGDGQ